MRKKLFNLILCTMCFISIFSLSTVFAGGAVSNDEAVITNILTSLLGALKWFALAIALGALMFIGIKYIMSPANEKANLKGLAPKYLIGIIAILCCTAIASFVANIAGGDGAEDIINVGKDFGIEFVDKVMPDTPDVPNTPEVDEKPCIGDNHKGPINISSRNMGTAYTCDACGETWYD